jgi:hypothetical protein
MPIIEEVPGATERPAGSRIRIWLSEDCCSAAVTIPSRTPSFWLIAASCVLLGNLMLLTVTGAMLFFAHRSVLFMTEISPGDLPLPMRRFEPGLIFVWLSILALAGLALAAMLRPMFVQETLTLGPGGAEYERRLWRRLFIVVIPQSELRGFHLKRDPEGLQQSELTLEGRGVSLAFAEYAGEAEREWLASAGSALLRIL